MNVFIIAFLIPLIMLGSSIAITINTSLINTADKATQRFEDAYEQLEENELNNPSHPTINNSLVNTAEEAAKKYEEASKKLEEVESKYPTLEEYVNGTNLY